jgi:hypothetical protein
MADRDETRNNPVARPGGKTNSPLCLFGLFLLKIPLLDAPPSTLVRRTEPEASY